MASNGEDGNGGFSPDSRKKALQDLLEFVKNGMSSQEDTSKTVDLTQDERHTWHSRFSDYFIASDRGDDCDDMLFFVKSKPSPDRQTSQSQDPREAAPLELIVHRKEAKNMPTLSDKLIRWNETLYLNLIMQDFEYTLTLGVCSADTQPMQPLDVFALKSQRVYATPSLQRMDKKGKASAMTFPFIYFTIDNFEEVFSDVAVMDNQKVVVQLTAFKPAYDALAVLFLGSVKYCALKQVFDSKESTASKIVSKASLGLWSGGQQRTEFVSMRGPRGHGRAQMAVSLNYVAAPPTSEPLSDSPLRWLRGRSSRSSATTPGAATISYHKRSGSNASSEGHADRSAAGSEVSSVGASACSSSTDVAISKTWDIVNDEDHAGFDGTANGAAAADEASVDIHTSSSSADLTDGAGVASRTLGWIMSPVTAVSKKLQDRAVCEMTTRLTYVMLPWHTILREILHPDRIPALPFQLDK